MRTRIVTRARFLAAGMALAALTACGGGGGSTPSPSASAGTPGVKTLSAALVAPSDLDGSWALSEKLKVFPDGKPGAIPEDYRYRLPTLDLCATAGSDAAKTAKDMTAKWQVFTTLDRGVAPNFVSVAEMLYADAPADVRATFQSLKDGIKACFGKASADQAETQPWDVPTVGEDRIGQQARAVAQGATWTNHVLLVRQGSVLMYLGVIGVGSPTTPALDDAALTAIAEAAAAKLPD